MHYNATIHCIQGPDRGKKWRWRFSRETTVVVGRLRGCHIVLKDRKISQSHCLFQVQSNRLCVIDMGSSHGTLVNGRQVTGALPLADGDVVGLGNSRLLFQILSEEQGPSAEKVDQGTAESVPFFATDPLMPSPTPKTSRPKAKTSAPTAAQSAEMSCSFCGATSGIQRLRSSSFCPDCEETAEFFASALPEYQVLGPHWHVPGLAAVVVVKTQRQKKLLCITSALPPGILLRVREELKGVMAGGHAHIYPALDEKMHRERFLTFLPYYPGAFAHRQGKIAPAEAMDIVMATGKALEYGTEKWGMHGEICPGNIYLEITGRPYLFGYGLVRHTFFSRPPQLGIFCCAPERIIRDTPPTSLSEVFSLGASLFTLMAGEPPYSGSNLKELREEATSFSPPRGYFEHSMVENFFQAAMHPVPEARYPGIPHFLDALSMVRCTYR